MHNPVGNLCKMLRFSYKNIKVLKSFYQVSGSARRSPRPRQSCEQNYNKTTASSMILSQGLKKNSSFEFMVVELAGGLRWFGLANCFNRHPKKIMMTRLSLKTAQISDAIKLQLSNKYSYSTTVLKRS